ncbi:MAG: hypothetical protein JST70_08285 [Bacteroidetes bacterium]|nr:hypothetical protein [Bacteroidota bacterium]
MRVWRILIPIYNLFWLFVVVTKISESIYAEYQDRNIEIPQKPTYTTGIVYAISILLNTLFSISKLINDDLKQNPVFQLLTGLNALTGVAFWIAYWIQTAQYKSQIKQFVGRDTL